MTSILEGSRLSLYMNTILTGSVRDADGNRWATYRPGRQKYVLQLRSGLNIRLPYLLTALWVKWFFWKKLRRTVKP